VRSTVELKRVWPTRSCRTELGPRSGLGLSFLYRSLRQCLFTRSSSTSGTIRDATCWPSPRVSYTGPVRAFTRDKSGGVLQWVVLCFAVPFAYGYPYKGVAAQVPGSGPRIRGSSAGLQFTTRLALPAGWPSTPVYGSQRDTLREMALSTIKNLRQLRWQLC